LPAGVPPMASIVVMRLPAAAAIGVTHEHTGSPSRWIVQAPHNPRPQPNAPRRSLPARAVYSKFP
jgi:hypothetical protein